MCGSGIFPCSVVRSRAVAAFICAIGAIGLLPARSTALIAKTTAGWRNPTAGVSETKSGPKGYPIALSAGSLGGIWYGGALEGSGRPEYVARIDYIAGAGQFTDFDFPVELNAFWPEAFAPAPDGYEWFLARSEASPVPVLGQISPLGAITLIHLQVAPGSVVRGLAAGSDGNLWMTDTRGRGHARTSSILRVTPAGAVTSFSTGLLPGAIPDNITAGPGRLLSFSDRAGRVGRIDPLGAITEFPIGRKLRRPGLFGPPPPIVVARDGAAWLVIDSRRLGRLSLSGRLQIFTPRPAWPPALRRYFEADSIAGLAAAPDGSVWFTRSSGEVARIDARGRVQTITKRLVTGRGLAFAGDGTAWIGEEASFRPEDSLKVIPARVASITRSGKLTQYPEPPPCHVPFVLGNGPSHAVEQLQGADCEIAGVRRPPHTHSNGLIVVSQSRRPGSVLGFRAPLRLVLGPKPPAPKDCRKPRLVRVMANSRKLIVWKDPIREADSAKREGEGAQRYFACVPGRPHKYLLFTEEFDSEYHAAIEHLQTAGHLIGYTSSSANHYNSGSDVAWVKRKLLFANREGKQVRTGQRDTLEVRERTGARAVVVTGGAISDLTLQGHVLRWDSSGEPRSRVLR